MKKSAIDSAMLTDRVPLNVTLSPEFDAWAPLNNSPESASPIEPEIPNATTPACEAGNWLPMEKLLPKCASGFLLLDSSLSPISFNTEALQILSYPDKPANSREPGVFLAEKIRALLVSRQASRDTPFVTEFRSGRRRYFCRAFYVDPGSKDSSQRIAILLERGPSGLIPLAKVSQQFNLTHREREALEYLLQGLSSKEIANRMEVSPNTVKTFLRLIMIKTGVSSRSAVIRKIIMNAT